MADPRHRLGLDAEDAAARWLSAVGWHVLARRCRPGAGGELDLVALDPLGMLVGIECRARRSDRAGRPAESLDGRRIARLRLALAAYAAASGMRHRGLRVDLVTARPDRDARERWRLARIPGIG